MLHMCYGAPYWTFLFFVVNTRCWCAILPGYAPEAGRWRDAVTSGCCNVTSSCFISCIPSNRHCRKSSTICNLRLINRRSTFIGVAAFYCSVLCHVQFSANWSPSVISLSLKILNIFSEQWSTFTRRFIFCSIKHINLAFFSQYQIKHFWTSNAKCK